MKKTLNINLAGYPFTIDEDAFNLLKDYLDTIRYAFETNDDTVELADDIETRIAELLISYEAGGIRIVTLNEVKQVIDRIGKPSEFIEVNDSHDSSETLKIDVSENIDENIKEENHKDNPVTPPPYDPNLNSRNPFVRKRIFRDPQNAMLGGVCSGLAAYLHIDPTIIRLITVVLFFLSATTVAIIYIVLWIVVPEANTPLQRMQMMGENPTVENIGKKLTENYQEPDKSPYSGNNKNNVTSFLSSVLSIFVKCLIFFGLFIAILLLIAFGAAFLGCAIAIFVIGIGLVSGGMFDSVAEGLMVLYILFAVIGGSITLGIPSWLFLKKFWKKKDYTPNPYNQRALLIAWLCGIALVAVFSVKAVKQARKVEYYDWKDRLERLEELNNTSRKNIDKIQLTTDGGVTVDTKDGKSINISKGKVTIDTKVTEEQSDTIVDTSDSLDATKESIKINRDSINIEEVIVDSLK